MITRFYDLVIKTLLAREYSALETCCVILIVQLALPWWGQLLCFCGVLVAAGALQHLYADVLDIGAAFDDADVLVEYDPDSNTYAAYDPDGAEIARGPDSATVAAEILRKLHP